MNFDEEAIYVLSVVLEKVYEETLKDGYDFRAAKVSVELAQEKLIDFLFEKTKNTRSLTC